MGLCDYVHACLCLYACVGGKGNWSCEFDQVCSGQAILHCEYSVVLPKAVWVWESDHSGLQTELRKNEEIADR